MCEPEKKGMHLRLSGEATKEQRKSTKQLGICKDLQRGKINFEKVTGDMCLEKPKLLFHTAVVLKLSMPHFTFQAMTEST